MSITTKAALLSYAQTQMRSKGYSAFSYADLAAKVGIRKASIHHHFPLSMLEGASLIDWTLGRSADPLLVLTICLKWPQCNLHFSVQDKICKPLRKNM
ncbi:TetR/AcrR family transcriptional regulator [Pseudomonas fluorescens]|uniref:TetR/AcrR family transcriptional regulator n=1 Tax=Pseudomonas fluorescens TaxID=294 RepID=UPI000B333A36